LRSEVVHPKLETGSFPILIRSEELGSAYPPGLPDGIFSNQKNLNFGEINRIWSILRSFGLFYGHLVYFMDVNTFCGILVYFSRFGILYQAKSGNPANRYYVPTEQIRTSIQASCKGLNDFLTFLI
jgi:hypothetical protein